MAEETAVAEKTEEEQKPPESEETKEAEQTEGAEGAEGGERSESTDIDLSQYTDEQIQSLIEKDPRFADAAYRSEGGQKLLEDTLSSLLEETQTKQTQAKEREEARAGLMDALKAYNDGDKDALADFAFQQLRRDAILAEARSQLQSEESGRIDALIQTVYGDELKSLSDADKQRLERIGDDGEFYRELLSTLAGKRAASGGDAETELSEARKAAASAAAGAQARGETAPMLPAGTSGEGAAGDDIGSLLKQGLPELYE